MIRIWDRDPSDVGEEFDEMIPEALWYILTLDCIVTIYFECGY